MVSIFFTWPGVQPKQKTYEITSYYGYEIFHLRKRKRLVKNICLEHYDKLSFTILV